MQELAYQDFTKSAQGGLNTRRGPLGGAIELTYRCNLNCIHCYSKGRETEELNTLQWKKILDEIHKEGCLWLTVTGGEPLLRKDFLEIYNYAYSKGLLISIFTNATLLSQKVLDFLNGHRPFCIEISLYGISKQVYESVTRLTGSFQKVRDNISRLLEINMPLVLKTVGLKQNKDEILKVKAFTERLLGKKRFKFDSLVLPRLDGDTAPCQYRLSIEEILKIENSDMDMLSQRKEQMHVPFELIRSQEFLYQCNAPLSNFFINPQGRLQFCHLSSKYSSNLTKESFKDGFYQKFPKLMQERFSAHSKCMTCSLRKDCYFCPARSYLETGAQEGPVEYYCELAKARQKERRAGIYV